MDDNLSYKIEQRKRIASLTNGKKDFNGADIVSIIVKADEFVIYEIKSSIISDTLKVYIDTEDEIDTKGILNNFNKIRSKFMELKGILYKVSDYAIYKARAAHIISHALYGNISEANEQFDLLIKEVNTQYSEQFKDRLIYLVTALCFVLVNLSISLALYLSHVFSKSNQVEILIYIATGGSLGGFISISRKLKQMVFEKEVASIMFILYSLERIFIAIFASIVIYFAIKSNLIFGFINDKLEQPIYGYILFSIVAGFSETLVPNLLIKLEEKPNKIF